MHFGHEGDPGQMLAETIMQVLPYAPLFSGATVEDCLFQVLSFCDVDPGSNDVLRRIPLPGSRVLDQAISRLSPCRVTQQV